MHAEPAMVAARGVRPGAHERGGAMPPKVTIYTNVG
jgi:hypothetical protein